MTINLPNGNTLTIVPSDSSARYSQLTGDDWIELKWESAEYVDIPTGSSVEFQGVTYTVERPQDVNIVSRRNHEYTVRFDTVAARLKYIKYINPDDGRVEFSVTGDANVHLNMLIRGANQLSGENWTAGNRVIGGKEATINYDGLYLYDAIELIAETFATEFEIAGTAIYLRKVEYNKILPLHLSYGNEVGNGLQPGIRRRNYGDRPKVVVLAVKGGNRNLNTSTNENSYDSKTLHMPVELSRNIPMVIGYDGKRFAYSDSWSQETGYHYKEDTGFDGSAAKYYQVGGAGRMLYYAGTNGTSPTMPALIAGTDMDVADLTWIYPTVTHTVTAVETRQETVTSPDGGSETYTAYNIKIQTTIDYHDAIIPGSGSLEIIFQTGQLAGKEFDVNFSLESGVGTFVIISKFIDDERMPGGTFIPAVGDTFRVFNCMLPQAYIREDSDNSGAEWEMAREAVKIMWDKGGIHYTWEADLSGIYAASLPQASFDKIRIGGYVSFSDPEVQPEDLLIRISEIKQPLNHPKWVEIKLEDFSRIRRRRRNVAMESSRAQVERQHTDDDIAHIEANVSLKPSVEQVVAISKESSSQERAAQTNTSSYWAQHSDVVPAVGDIYVYSDGGSIQQGGVTINVPKIKVGDGVTTIGNLPFTDSNNQGGAASLYISVTYSQLVAKISNSKLVKGCIYRITDFVTTTDAGDNPDINYYNYKSAMHPFDLLVLATSENTIDAKAKAVLHEGDTYFEYCDLYKWQIWYSVENQKCRWGDYDGKGVIYRMIDEWGNDCPYDFKNIMFKRMMTNNELDETNGTLTWVYTFDSGYGSDNSIGEYTVYNNRIGNYIYDDDGSTGVFLNDIVFLVFCYNNVFGKDCHSITLHRGFHDNKFGDKVSSVVVGNYAHDNIIGNNCEYITINGSSYSNTIKDGCAYIRFGDASNAGGSLCRYNVVGAGNYYINIYNTDNSNDYLQNIYIAPGINIATDLNISTITRGRDYRTTVGRDSSGDIRIYNEDDPASGVTIYSGSSAPSSATGIDGDIYIQEVV